eukprot:277458-Rhodomonas_salina.1
MSGTEIAYGVVWGTDRAYGAIVCCYVISDIKIAYGAMCCAVLRSRRADGRQLWPLFKKMQTQLEDTQRELRMSQ